MRQRDFETLFSQLEKDLSFIDNAIFFTELKASIKTPEQWARLAKLYCESARKLIRLIDSVSL